MGRDHEVRSYHFSKKKKTCLKNKKICKNSHTWTMERHPWRFTVVVLALPGNCISSTAVPSFTAIVSWMWNTCPICSAGSLWVMFLAVCVCVCFHEGLLFPPPVVRLWKRGTNIGIRSALCAPTATLTSNRRATSSWRGSCTAKLTPGPARGPQRAMTQSPFIPKLKS